MIGPNIRSEAVVLMDQRRAMEVEIETIVARLSGPDGPGVRGRLVDSEGFPFSHFDIPAVRRDRGRLAELHNDHLALTARIERLIHDLHAAAPPKRPAHNSQSALQTKVEPPEDTDLLKAVEESFEAACTLPQKRAAEEEAGNVRGEAGAHEAQQMFPRAEEAAPAGQAAELPLASVSVAARLMDTDELVALAAPFAVIDEVAASSPAEADGIQVGDLIVQFGAVTAGPDCIRNVAVELQRSDGLQIPVKLVRRGVEMELRVVPRTWSGRGRLGCHLRPL